MNTEPKHTPSRIVLARMRRGLLVWQLADSTGISRRRMWNLERGSAVATEAELDAIGERLRFPVAFFFRPHMDIPTLRDVVGG